MVDPAAPRPLPQIEVDASMVAQALGLPLDEFRQLMDCGRIRTLSERGTGADSGHFRLSFWHGKRRYQVVTDADGRVVERTVR